MKQNYAFVVDTDYVQQNPIHPAVARKLLRQHKAAILRRYPFTIVLKEHSAGPLFVQSCRLKIDPGSKKTGFALVQGNAVVWAGELEHRGHTIKNALEKRRSLRRGRRNRKTRYRSARFLNRTKPKGWLPPSLRHRVETTMSWVSKLCRYAPVHGISVERVRFDMQLIRTPTIQGVAYQQGELWQQEVRQYVFTRAGYQCAYCGAKDVPLEIEHITPRAQGGTNAPSNLTAACRPCNQRKGNQRLEDFLKRKPAILRRIKSQMKSPLKDAAAVNATRWRLWEDLCMTGWPVEAGTGGRTAWNRKRQGLAKTHWIDAACVGASTPERLQLKTEHPLLIKSIGRGTHQVVRVDKYGFPRGKAGRIKRAFGFSAGDLVRLNQPHGKYKGVWIGTMAGIRERGDHDIRTTHGHKITSKWSNFTLIERASGYSFA